MSAAATSVRSAAQTAALAGAPNPGGYRILHVFRTPVGGLFRHVVDLARLQSEAGHRVGIVCDSSTGGARAEQVLAELAPCLALGVTRMPMLRNPGLSDFGVLSRLRAVAERVRANVLHGHGAKGGAYARLVGVRNDGPAPIRAYTPHGGSYHYEPGTAQHRLYMAAEGMLARRTDLFLFESQYVADRHRTFVGGPPRSSRIVRNGLSEAEFAPVVPAFDAATGPFDLVYIGELRDLKGIPWLLSALASLHSRGRRLRLLMVGAGPDAAALEAKVADLGLSDAVRFEPPQPIRPVLARARLMVVPSLAESLPYVVLEAAAARQPLVATNVGGIPEIFGAFAADLVAPRDADALAAAIARTLDEPAAQRAARVAALAASLEERFSLRSMGEAVLSGYAAAFAERGEVRAPAPARAAAITADSM